MASPAGTVPACQPNDHWSLQPWCPAATNAERQKLANEQAAINGKRFLGGPRPFGYRDDHVTAPTVEPASIRGILLNPRIAGLSVYRGEIVGQRN